MTFPRILNNDCDTCVRKYYSFTVCACPFLRDKTIMMNTCIQCENVKRGIYSNINSVAFIAKCHCHLSLMKVYTCLGKTY